MSENLPKIFELLSGANAPRTPCYLYSPNTVLANYRRLRDAVGTPLIVSVKANPCAELLARCAHAFEDGVEVASTKELALVTGRFRGPRYINTPALTKPLMSAASSARATLVLDNLHQVGILRELHKGAQNSSVILRINAAAVHQFDPGPMRVRTDHFGMDFETALLAARQLAEIGIAVHGVHVFKGSYTFTDTAIATIAAAREFIRRFEQESQQKLAFINLGGGFAEQWDQQSFDYAAYRSGLCELAAGVKVVHEAGRAVFGSAGYFLTRVIATKELHGEFLAVCDGGISHNFLLGQTERVFRNYRTPRLWRPGGDDRPPAQNGTGRPVTFVGPSCSKDDIIGKLADGAALPAPGDVCIFDNCGAYNSTYTVAGFLSLDVASEYILP